MNKIFEIKTPEQIVNDVSESSKEGLNYKDDLVRIITIAADSNKTELLEDIAFTGKFLNGLFSIIQRGESVVNEEVFYKYTQEYTQNIEKLRTQLTELLNNTSKFVKDIFDEKYLGMNKESLDNLTKLCSDLNKLKIYLNDKKNPL